MKSRIIRILIIVVVFISIISAFIIVRHLSSHDYKIKKELSKSISENYFFIDKVSTSDSDINVHLINKSNLYTENEFYELDRLIEKLYKLMLLEKANDFTIYLFIRIHLDGRNISVCTDSILIKCSENSYYIEKADLSTGALKSSTLQYLDLSKTTKLTFRGWIDDLNVFRNMSELSYLCYDCITDRDNEQEKVNELREMLPNTRVHFG